MIVYTPGAALLGTVIVPSAFTVGVGCPATIGCTVTLVIVSVLPVPVVVLPSAFTTRSLLNTLGVVRVPVPVTTKPSGFICGVGCVMVTVS